MIFLPGGYRPGKLSRNDIIVIAQHLMTHGIIGKAKIRKLQRHETNETTKEFNAVPGRLLRMRPSPAL
ncbi:hypothetical protein FZI24_20770 [Cronobacter sakazakii]|nr:hypothetical protein FZI24_20770 [Cronobacter sakazakii]